MRILRPGSSGEFADSWVLVYGLGMIGSAITDALCRLGYEIHSDIPFDWNNAAQRQRAEQQIMATCAASAPSEGKLSVVWSAGEAAFHSTEKEVALEQAVFNQSIETLKHLRESIKPSRFVFHFISSAGGLFEGQRVVGPDSRPAPKRPYGQLKLAQEQALLAKFEARELAIYRPSSVYGPMQQNARKGLINNLVNNGRSGRVTVLEAHVMSLRDYVFSHDIGNFVARCIRSGVFNDAPGPERFLVSARCSSILEVVRKIQRILKLNLRVRYDENFGNNRSITFNERVLPAGWNPVTLDVGLRQFLVGAS